MTRNDNFAWLETYFANSLTACTCRCSSPPQRAPVLEHLVKTQDVGKLSFLPSEVVKKSTFCHVVSTGATEKSLQPQIGPLYTQSICVLSWGTKDALEMDTALLWGNSPWRTSTSLPPMEDIHLTPTNGYPNKTKGHTQFWQVHWKVNEGWRTVHNYRMCFYSLRVYYLLKAKWNKRFSAWNSMIVYKLVVFHLPRAWLRASS